MDYGAVERARERLEAAAKERTEQAQIDAALDRARNQIEALAELAAQLEASLPAKVGEAVQEGLRAEALPVARQLAEVRGLAGQTIRRLERIEGDTLAERHARVDDLALLVDLITSGWQSVDDRLARLEKGLTDRGGGAIVYRLEEAQERKLSNY
jgi:type II secretory pathway component PulM